MAWCCRALGVVEMVLIYMFSVNCLDLYLCIKNIKIWSQYLILTLAELHVSVLTSFIKFIKLLKNLIKLLPNHIMV